MNNPINFKFLNKPPMILGFEVYDCLIAVFISMAIFIFTFNHLLSLITGFAIVFIRSIYKRIYPKNTIYFFKNKKQGIHSFQLMTKKGSL
jgi:type IV secretory pathway VirB3-like protein